MKNLNLGDIVRYDKGDYLSYYFLIVEKQEIKSDKHHAGYLVAYKIKNMETDRINILFSDNKIISTFVRQND